MTQRSRGRILVIGLAVAVGLGATPRVAASQQSQRFAWWRAEAVVSELGLTAEQTESIETVFQSMRQEARQELGELERLEAKLSRLIQSDAEEGAIVRQIDRVETARAALSKTRSLMLLRIRKVLTAEQRTSLTELQGRWERDGRPPTQSPRR